MHAPTFITDGPPQDHRSPLHHPHGPRVSGYSALDPLPLQSYGGLHPPPTPSSYPRYAMNPQIREPYPAYAFAMPSPGALLQFAAHEQMPLVPHFSQQRTHSTSYPLTPPNVSPTAIGLANNTGTPISWSTADRELPQQRSFSTLGGVPFQRGRHDFLAPSNAFASLGIHSRLRHESDMVSRS